MNEFAILLLCSGALVGVVVLVFAFRMMQVDKQVDAGQPPPTQSTAEPAPADMADPPEAASPAAPPPAPVFTPSPDPHPAFTEVATLIRTPDGMLALQAGGNLYLRGDDITDPRLLAALNELERFLKNGQVLPPAPPKPVEEVDGKPTVYMSAREAAQVPLTAPSLDILKQYRYLRERDKQPEIKIKTVIEEIDEVLQEKAANTSLAKRGLKVSAGEAGAALFWIDGRSYLAADEVPDPEARALVKAAIQEWEMKK